MHIENRQTGQRQTVSVLWHGDELSVYERLCLRSFVRQGHPVDLYSYAAVEAPAGVSVRDAREVLPEEDVFCYTDGMAKGSFAAFSNLFRYKLLLDRGGIWADADVLCLKPFDDLPEACVGYEGRDGINGAVMKFSAGHPLCASLYEQARALGRDIVLGQAGPNLITSSMRSDARGCIALPAHTFYPINWRDAWMLIDPDEYEECVRLAADSYCVHWWHGALHSGIGLPKYMLPPAGSYLQRAAEEVLGEDMPILSERLVKIWIRNYRGLSPAVVEAHGRPLTGLLKSDLHTIAADAGQLALSFLRRVYPQQRS